jgi:hypothetical protein
MVMTARKSAPVSTPKQPDNWDSVVNGLWRPPEPPGKAAASAPAPAPPPKYDYDAQPQEWKNYVQGDGSITMTPFGGGGRKYWGPVG